MAASTRSRVSWRTWGLSWSTRETVWWETPASSATSSITAGRRRANFGRGTLIVSPPRGECVEPRSGAAKTGFRTVLPGHYTRLDTVHVNVHTPALSETPAPHGFRVRVVQAPRRHIDA